MKAIYKPFGIVMGLLSGLLASQIFNFIWQKFDDEEAPKPTTELATLPKLVASSALQGVVFKLTRLAVDRSLAKGYANLTGVWPGERRPEPRG